MLVSTIVSTLLSPIVGGLIFYRLLETKVVGCSIVDFGLNLLYNLIHDIFQYYLVRKCAFLLKFVQKKPNTFLERFPVIAGDSSIALFPA